MISDVLKDAVGAIKAGLANPRNADVYKGYNRTVIEELVEQMHAVYVMLAFDENDDDRISHGGCTMSPTEMRRVVTLLSDGEEGDRARAEVKAMRDDGA
jgi:hypothetical protein